MQVRQPVQRAQRSLRAAPQIAAQPLYLLHERGLGGSRLGRSGDADGASGALIKVDLDAAAGSSGPDTERTVVAEPMQHTLHVLAAAQPVGAVVMTLTRVDALAQGAHLDDVTAAARRGDPVIAERVMVCVERNHLVDLGAAAPMPALDLVLVARDPPEHRGRPLVRPPLALLRLPLLSCTGHGAPFAHGVSYPCRLGAHKSHAGGARCRRHHGVGTCRLAADGTHPRPPRTWLPLGVRHVMFTKHDSFWSHRQRDP